MCHTKKRDPKAFDAFWDSVVLHWWKIHEGEPGLSMPDWQLSKSRLMAAYHELNRYCSETYMVDEMAPLNQRKIAACMALAIVVTCPIHVDYKVKGCMDVVTCADGRSSKASIPMLANERLAVSAMLSIVSGYIKKAIWDTELCELSESERNTCQESLNKGFDLLQEADGGEWLLNLEKSLGLMAIEGNMNIPILSCLVAYLEASIVPREMYRRVLDAFERASVKPNLK